MHGPTGLFPGATLEGSMTIDVLIEEPGWHGLGLEALAKRAARATLDRLGLEPRRFDISLLGCNDTRIATLNADFRGKATPTNVLSWPAEDLSAEKPGAVPALPQATDSGPTELGDIAIAWQTCQREAAEAGRDLSAHVCHLLVHGVLHLLGYDHMSDEDAALMEGLEVEILASMGLEDPY